MGRTRMFTEEVYDNLQLGVANDGFLNAVGDFFSDIPLHIENAFSGIELEDDMSNFKSYLQETADLNDYSSEKIHTIFIDVDDVDRHFGELFENENGKQRDYITIVEKLKTAVADRDFAEHFTKAKFMSLVPKEAQTMTGIHWREILSREPEEITAQEYRILAEYLIRSEDEMLLEEVLNDCYSYRDAAVYHDGGYLITEKVVNASSGKIKKLAQAVNQVMQIWTIQESLGLVQDSDRKYVRNAIMYNSLFHGISQYEEMAVVSQRSEFDMNYQKILNEKLIVVKNNKDGSISAVFYPNISGPTNFAVEKGGKTVLTVSKVEKGDNARQAVYEKCKSYINAYTGAGNSVVDDMKQETVMQIMTALTGAVPNINKISAVTSVLGAGVKSHEATTIIQKSEEIGDIGRMLDKFEIIYVSTDINEKSDSYTFSMYRSGETETKIAKFNQFMQSEEAKELAQRIGYNDLPEGKLTYKYMMDEPKVVVDMLEAMRRDDKLELDYWNKIESGSFDE